MFDVAAGDGDLVVVSLPIADEVDALELTPAERDVARDAAAGLSNAAIGRRRRRSARTVANQLASIYRKLGIGSRAELAAKLARERR